MDPRVQFELTRYLSDNWVPILEKDVDGPNSLPLQLDSEVPNLGKFHACRRVARAIYLGSAPMPTAANRSLEDRRVKLARELSKKGTGRTIYILDEPTTGLHADDIRKLLNVLGKLVDSGNTVIVIEHNLDVIKYADYILDLGPEGGDRGGEIIGAGTPEQIAENKRSYTGHYLKKVLL